MPKYDVDITGGGVDDEDFDCRTPLETVEEFHNACDIPIAATCGLLPAPRRGIRIAILREEYDEYLVAAYRNDIVGVAHELADMLYVIYGTALEYGIDMDRVFYEVHKANMTKVGADGTVEKNVAGKVMKGDGYVPPDIARILQMRGWVPGSTVPGG